MKFRGLGYKILGVRFRVEGSKLMVWGVSVRSRGLKFRVQGSQLRV